MSVISELITNAGHSTGEGFIGVSAIFIYFFAIVGMALKRIKELKAHH